MNASKKRALSQAAGDEEEDFIDDGESRSKKAKSSSSSSSLPPQGSDPNVVQLGASKRIEVRKFKGMVLIDIRETYIDKTSGEERPGKKGKET